MDSGAPLPSGEQQPNFDPLTPLLPEEVCWILDRAMACEVNADDGLSRTSRVCSSLYLVPIDALARRECSCSDGVYLLIHASPADYQP